jgi:hypothetical protein
MLLLRLLVTCALAFHSVIGKVYHDIRDLPADFEQFDFIIAGGKHPTPGQMFVAQIH